MNTSIVANVTYTPDDYVNAMMFIPLRRPLPRYFGAFCLAVVFLFALYLFLLSPGYAILLLMRPLNMVLVLVTVLYLLWLIYSGGRNPRFLIKLNLKRQFKESPSLREPKTLIISEEGLSGTSDLGEGKTKWEAFIEAIETKDTFLFFTTKKFAQFVPKRIYTDEQREQIRTLLKSEMGDRVKSLL